MDINRIKEIVCESGKKLLTDGLVSGTWGNISCRVDDKYMVITPSGVKYEDLTSDDMILMRIDDLTYEGDKKPSSEKYIHADIYKAHKEINAIVHNHSLYASIVSAVRPEVQPYVSDMAMILGPSVKVAKHEMSGSKELSEGAVAALEDRFAVILQNHGAICIGRDMEEAFIACQILEKACQIQVSVDMLGGGEPLEKEIAQKYRDKYLNVYQKK